jgi:hypothetical protein
VPLPTLSVKLDGPSGRGGTVLLDGHDITGGLIELDISIRHDDLTRAHLVIGVGEIEMDAQTLAVLAAIVKAPADAEATEPQLPRCFGEEPAHA